MTKQKTKERSSGVAELESHLLLDLASLGVYPEALEIVEGKVRVSDESSSYRVAIDKLLAGLEASRGDWRRRCTLQDRPLAGQIRHLSWLGKQILGDGKP
jgi:hypothetical protein